MRRIKSIIKKSINAVVESVYFFWFKNFGKKPRIMSFEETINEIVDKKKCIARYGDGEMKLMLKTGEVGFQKANNALSTDLFNSFIVKKSNLLVCYHDIPLTFSKRSDEFRFYKKYLFKTYRRSLKIIDMNYYYGNTNFTRFYHPSLCDKTDFSKLDEYIKGLKKIWDKKQLLIVEGSETKLGIGNDLFDNCLSIRRIICPKINAYGKIDDIYNTIISKVRRDELILVALGPTASVLCTRIALNTNLQAIDIGHIDIVYLWCKYRCDSVCRVSGKYVNEAKKDSKVLDIVYDENEYNKQIVANKI